MATRPTDDSRIATEARRRQRRRRLRIEQSDRPSSKFAWGPDDIVFHNPTPPTVHFHRLQGRGLATAQTQRDARAATLDTRMPGQFQRLADWEIQMGGYE